MKCGVFLDFLALSEPGGDTEGDTNGVDETKCTKLPLAYIR